MNSKPSNLRPGAESASTFYYGADRKRWKQQATYSGGDTETTLYVGDLLQRVTVSSGTAYRHYIPAGDGKIVYTRWSTGANLTYYVTTDHLGGSSAVTDGSGAMVVRESFAAYGARRGSNWTGPPSAPDLTAIANTTRQGFTGHEMLDNLGLIHMNGRVYDPVIGRFLSADPYMDFGTGAQALNRYAYVGNNPLTYIDPSGFTKDCVVRTASNECIVEEPRWQPDFSWYADLERNLDWGRTSTPFAAEPVLFYGGVKNEAAGSESAEDGTQPQTQTLEEVLVTAQKKRKLAGIPINFSLPFPREQMWIVDANGNIVFVHTVSERQKCSDGTEAGANRPADPKFSLDGAVAAIHTHSTWGLPFPGPRDGQIPSGFGIPNYGISPSGVWVVNPGPTLGASLISGSWGRGPNGESFSPAAYAGAINAPGSGGGAVKCR